MERVIDGDTFTCDANRTIRMLLIDAPESNQGPFGAVAKLELKRLLPPGAAVGLESDVDQQDRYGRVLAYVLLPDGRLANEEMLRSGMAVVAVYPPNVHHVERFRAVAESAKAGQRGLWATSAFECLPADQRAGRCR